MLLQRRALLCSELFTNSGDASYDPNATAHRLLHEKTLCLTMADVGLESGNGNAGEPLDAADVTANTFAGEAAATGSTLYSTTQEELHSMVSLNFDYGAGKLVTKAR